MLKCLYPLLLLLFSLVFVFSCAPAQNDLDTLLSYMTGSFSSESQASSDTNFYDIRLHHAQIWKERTDGYWLYVEQAAAENPDKPYRQRIYNLNTADDSTYKSIVYTMAEPMRFAGAWKDLGKLDGLSPETLEERGGCAIILKKHGPGIYVGLTESLSCSSDLRGASYATSIVLISKDEIYSWDRGFDMSGQQVWGARTGGYKFKKQQSM